VTLTYLPSIQPFVVLKSRVIPKRTRPVQQFLIQWENGLVEDAIWKDNSLLAQAYPHFHLEDKVKFDGGRIVRKRNAMNLEPDQRVGPEGIIKEEHMAGGKNVRIN